MPIVNTPVSFLCCLLLLAGVGSARADLESPTAVDWLGPCKSYLRALEGDSSADDFDLTYCIGMTQGIVNGMRTGSQLGALSMGSTLAVRYDLDPGEVFDIFQGRSPDTLLQICTPAAAGVTDHVKIIAAYLDSHPDKSGQPLAEIFFEALQEAWPCE